MLTIGKAAARANVTPDTLRYYEREGLIRPATKSEAGYRLYDTEQVRRLQFIRQAQECGFAMGEIRQLLAVRGHPAACCGDVRKLAIEKKLQMEAKIKTMRTMSRALDGLIADCANEARPVEDCPILAAFDKPMSRA
ncbi:MAG: heavy metal-responsive transcriptional regulator [Rhodospirillales bacterium]|nr:heavy metal-responsive transcriptional regulator [Rhodospirillales bacterium]